MLRQPSLSPHLKNEVLNDDSLPLFPLEPAVSQRSAFLHLLNHHPGTRLAFLQGMSRVIIMGEGLKEPKCQDTELKFTRMKASGRQRFLSSFFTVVCARHWEQHRANGRCSLYICSMAIMRFQKVKRGGGMTQDAHL